MGEGNIRRWNEFDYELYNLEVQLDTENSEHQVEFNFGMRQGGLEKLMETTHHL
jgi:hypothetical protein